MANYRPVCDTWILARSKVRYYGAYPAGFLSRARSLLGVTINQPVLHVCGGMVKDYPFAGFGPNDVTMDADPSLEPDIVQDVREPWKVDEREVDAVLMDPPYTPEDADHYAVGAEMFPQPAALLHSAMDVLNVGQRVGLLHYTWTKPPEGLKNIAVITVLVGFNNRARLYSVYERV